MITFMNIAYDLVEKGSEPENIKAHYKCDNFEVINNHAELLKFAYKQYIPIVNFGQYCVIVTFFAIKYDVSRLITIMDIAHIVSGYYKITIKEMLSKTRVQRYSKPRQIAMYFACKYTKATLAVIAKELGEKDHATALHARRVVGNMIETKDYEYYDQIVTIENIIESRMVLASMVASELKKNKDE